MTSQVDTILNGECYFMIVINEDINGRKNYLSKWCDANLYRGLGLLYGKAGIGKSIVMHTLLEELQSNPDYLVLGLKSDQIEFVDTEVLRQNIHLAKPIETVVEEIAQKYKRVILLIDQIDALSLSLSSNRTPLRSLLKLIGQIQHIPNVRVVISCRPNDLEYDPLLDNLRIKNKWELKEFTDDQVKRILSENGCVESISDNLLRFLGNPLHLFLFLKVKPEEQLTDPLSTDLLYHQLWRKYVLDDSVRKVGKERLLSLFDKLVATMYERQELSVHIFVFVCHFISTIYALNGRKSEAVDSIDWGKDEYLTFLTSLKVSCLEGCSPSPSLVFFMY